MSPFGLATTHRTGKLETSMREYTPMSLREFTAILAIFAASLATAHAGTIIQYDTEGVGSGAPTVASVPAINPASDVTGVDVTRGAGLTPVAASFAINSSGWNDLAADDYY